MPQGAVFGACGVRIQPEKGRQPKSYEDRTVTIIGTMEAVEKATATQPQRCESLQSFKLLGMTCAWLWCQMVCRVSLELGFNQNPGPMQENHHGGAIQPFCLNSPLLVFLWQVGPGCYKVMTQSATCYVVPKKATFQVDRIGTVPEDLEGL